MRAADRVQPQRTDGAGAPFALIRPAAALSQFKESQALIDLLHLPTDKEMQSKLSLRSIPKGDAGLWDADPGHKIAAYTFISNSYLPFAEVREAALKFKMRIFAFWSARSFDDPEYRCHYFHALKVLDGAPLKEMPSSLSRLSNGVFPISGPSRMGRTAFLDRLCEMVGRPFDVEGLASPAPLSMRVIPCIRLTIPASGALEDLLRQIRASLQRALAHVESSHRILPEITGSNALNATVAAFTLFNVCSVVVDGGVFQGMESKVVNVVRFLLGLQREVGMPMFVSGTAAFMHVCQAWGGQSSNMFGSSMMELNPLGPPPDPLKSPEEYDYSDGQSDEAGSSRNRRHEGRRSPGRWYQHNLFLWRMGLFRPVDMPVALATWTHEFAAGVVGWLVMGFEELLCQIAKRPELLESEKLTKEFVARVFDKALAGVASALRVVRESQTSARRLKNDADFVEYADYLTGNFVARAQNQRLLMNAWGVAR